MHWATFFVSAAPLWLSLLGSGNASILPKDTLARRQNGPPGEYVFHGDERSPREIRAADGFQPQGPGWGEQESSYNMNRHFHAGPRGCGLDEFDEPGFVFRTAYVSMARERQTSEAYGEWLYEIRATPNILDAGYAGTEVLALGGVHWRQIRRYTRMRNRDANNRVDEAAWINNPEYDAALYETERAHQCYVNEVIPRQLHPDSDSDDNMSDSDSDSGEASARPRFAAADRFMNRTAGIFELYGAFPPTFTPPSQPRDDIPGPDHPQPPVPMDEQVARELQHYISMGSAQLDQLFPNAHQVVAELFGDLNAGCSAWSNQFGSKKKRSDLRTRANGQDSPKATGGSCCKVLSKLRSGVRSKRPGNKGPEATQDSFGLTADETQRLRAGQFTGLNCTVLIQKIQQSLSSLGNGGVGDAAAPPSGTGQGDCDRAQAMVTPKSRNKGKKQPQPPPAEPAKIVFYGDYLWPTEAKKQGGFLPPDTTPPGPTYEIISPEPAAGGEKVDIEWANYLIPTYLTLGAAAKQAALLASEETKGFAGVVYAVHATPNMVSSGSQAAAVGGILWSQVLGWMQVPEGYAPPAHDAQARGDIEKHFKNAFDANKELFQKNDDYNSQFDQYSTTVEVQQQFSSSEDLAEFMKTHGQAVGWTGGFPLFQTPEVITGETSKAAKASNAVSVPHEPGTWERIGSFIKNHALAIALLPAVAALNLIPGLGEVADAAELAALCTESVEGIELAEVGSSSLSEAATGVSQLLRGVAKLKVA